MAEGPDLLDWYPRHITAMVFQILSIIGSTIIILSFFILKNRRSPFHYQVLFLNMADVIWTSSHFLNHIQAVANKKVTDNGPMCTAMGLFTHLGIGWELSWMIVIGAYTTTLIHHADQGRSYKPPKRIQIIVAILAWGIPVIWWGIIGLPLNVYDNSTGYFCWVKIGDPMISFLFSDGPLILCCIIVTSCYGYVAYSLFRFSTNRAVKESGVRTFSKEIKRAILYIFVYLAWVHPYLTFTITTMLGKTPSRGLWVYFLAMTNSMGTLNFLAYGHSEEWFAEIRYRLCGCGTPPPLTTSMISYWRHRHSLAESTVSKNVVVPFSPETDAKVHPEKEENVPV